ncbi:MAG: UvrD-helicase domain-containing protein [Burkholderiales bacterium]|nr:UvrD-helicase domain-containing protein [Burkholderiales bacterium]
MSRRRPEVQSPQELDVFGCELAGTQLVEASAGTGKTWNLCALVLRLLLERGLALPQILVVTFTNAATAELRERIRGRLRETLDALQGRGPAGSAAAAAAAAASAAAAAAAASADLREGEAFANQSASGRDPFVPSLLRAMRESGLDDATMAARLDEALQSFDEAAIHTIHGYCQRVLADNAFGAGVPLAQELLADDRDLRLQAVQDFWRRHVAGPGADPSAASAPPPALLAWLMQRGDSPEAWVELLRRHLAQPMAELRWPADIDSPLDDGAALDHAFAQAQSLWQAQRDDIVAALLDALPRLHGGSYKPETIATAAAQWDLLLGGTDPLDPVEKDATKRKLHLLAMSTLAARTTQIKGDKSKARHPPPRHPFFDAADELLTRRAERERALALARLRLLRALLAEAPAALREAKQARRVLAFDDLLQQLHDRLHARGGDALAAALRTRYPAALIDEFQDTDPLQFAIFQRIYGGSDDPLVLMGDPKQAIYSFRGADLHTYLAARRHARAEHTLAENQRSCAELLHGLNALFGRQPRAFLQPGLDYHRVRRGGKPLPALHDAGAGAQGDLAAALQLWRLPADAEGQPLAKPAARHAAASATAGEIARLLAAARRGELTLGGRPAAAGDFAVLVRSHAQGSLMRRALAAVGVGAVELSQASVFHSAEAEELDRVLAAMLEPTREPLLRAALATELMGVAAAALDALAADESGWLAVLATFAEDRQTWRTRGVAVMLRRWMDRAGVAARLLARPDGERRMTNLLHLADLLQQAAGDHAGPEALHRWLQSRRREPHGDEAMQLRLESDRDLVRIVTIHKSKGLEYPFVYCPFLWDGRPGAPAGRDEALAYHDDDGRQVLDFEAPLLDDDSAAAVKARVGQEEAAEQLRLAYVALTRAVHRCSVVVGGYRSGRSVKESGRSALAWLVAGSEGAAAGWPRTGLDPAEVDAAWIDFAASHSPQVRLADLPTAAAAPLPRERPDAATLAALPPPARIPAPWWIASYSALVAGRDLAAQSAPAIAGGAADPAPDHAVADRDRMIAPDLAPDVATDPGAVLDPELGMDPTPAADDILRFPRGPLAGECLHAVFEHADLADPATWPAAIDAALQARPQPVTDPADAARQGAMLQRMLADVLATPLPLPVPMAPTPACTPTSTSTPVRAAQGRADPSARDGASIILSDIPAARRRAELEFTLPVARLSADDLDQALRSLGWPAPALGFGTLQGYLRGFIDLVFEHHGRWGLLDWKSNHLGARRADYTAGRVAQAVHDHGYQLQALLYLLALHRWLRHRLPGYDYDRHVAGAWVLFVRGVRPGWTDDAGRPTGIWSARPPRELIESLSARLDGGDA